MFEYLKDEIGGIKMAYLGRVLGLMETEAGKPAVLYAISGRSDFSKAREFNVFEQTTKVSNTPIIGTDYFGDSVAKQFILRVDPLNGKMTEDQIALKDLIFYNAIIAQNTNARTGKPYIAVTNGTQTDIIAKMHDLSPWQVAAHGRQLEKILDAMEVETDPPMFTARIAGEFNYHGRLENPEDKKSKVIYDRMAFIWGIITNTPQLVSMVYGQHYASRGIATMLMTYVDEKDGILIPPKSEKGLISEMGKQKRIEGETADEICSSFAEFMQKEFDYVSAAAVVLEEDGWKFSVINKEKELRAKK